MGKKKKKGKARFQHTGPREDEWEPRPQTTSPNDAPTLVSICDFKNRPLVLRFHTAPYSIDLESRARIYHLIVSYLTVPI